MEAPFGVPGYLVVINADGAEIEVTRKDVTGCTHDELRIAEATMRVGLGDGCYVVFRERAEN